MGKAVEIFNDEGDTVMTIESFRREGSKLVIEGRPMGAWKSDMYLPPEAIPRMLRLLMNFSVISFILLFPFSYLRKKDKKKEMAFNKKI